RYAEGESAEALAAEFGVTRNRIHFVVRARGFTVRRPVSTRRLLTAEQVVEIRRRYAAGESQTALAPDFGVQQNTISTIVRGDAYRDVDGARKQALERRPRRGQRFFTDDDIRTIRARYAAGGVSQGQLAKEYDTGQTQISAIVRRQSYREV